MSDATPLYLQVQAGEYVLPSLPPSLPPSHCPPACLPWRRLHATIHPGDHQRHLPTHPLHSTPTDGSKGSVLSHADVLQKGAWPVVSGVLSKQLTKVGV